MTTNAQDPNERQGNEEKIAAVEASDLEAAPASQTGPQGDSFYNPALTGSGTIMPDGTYGAPLPDPNLIKRNEDPEITTELKEPEQPTAKATEPAPAKRSRTSGSAGN